MALTVISLVQCICYYILSDTGRASHEGLGSTCPGTVIYDGYSRCITVSLWFHHPKSCVQKWDFWKVIRTDYIILASQWIYPLITS